MGGAVLNGAGALLGGGGGGGGGGGDGKPLFKPTDGQYGFTAAGKAAPVIGGAGPRSTSDPTQWWQRQGLPPGALTEQTNFNKIRIISENKDMESELVFEDSSVTVNNRIAKKIMNLHESLNKRNKRKVEKMINEDVTSLRKVINFAVRQ